MLTIGLVHVHCQLHVRKRPCTVVLHHSHKPLIRPQTYKAVCRSGTGALLMRALDAV
jgi:hypothetical protein